MNLQKRSHNTLINSPHTVTVSLGDRSYPIYIGNGLLDGIEDVLLQHGTSTSIVIITDNNVSKRYLPVIRKSLGRKKFSVRSIVIPSGERQKSLERSEKIYTQLLKWNIERSSTIVALGGGVIGDLAGFIASTYQRGIGFVQIPTTLLAQVDSSVGGKVGINHHLAKNMIGAFYQPKFVLADTDALKTLPRRELVCGLGEIVKYGIILDKEFFQYSEKNLEWALKGDPVVLKQMVQRSCELKAQVVSNDEKEANVRAILNFGHTIGHALEHAGNYGTLKHGEAILYGMVAETHIAFQLKMISFTEKERIEQLIRRIPLPSLEPLKLKHSALIQTMKKDKKVKNGSIRMTLPFSIGKVSLPMEVNDRLIVRAIEYVKLYGS